MSIEKIRNNNEIFVVRNLHDKKSVNNRAYLGTPQDSVSFTGVPVKAPKNLKEYLLGLMSQKIRGMVKINESRGEIQNQFINALGTGLVAPVFIKWNPLSDKDQDTRTYTAWRQPVSAVLAMSTQGTIVIPFNRLIKKLSDVGYLHDDYNASLFPSDDYIKKQVKKANPNVKYTKDTLEDAIDAEKQKYDKRLVNMIEEDHIVWNTTNGKTVSTLEMPKENFKNLFIETLDSIIKSEQEAKLNAVEKKLPNKIKRGVFYFTNPNESVNFLTNLKQTLKHAYQVSEHVDDLSSIDYKKGKADFKKACKTLIKNLKKEAKKDVNKKDLYNEFIKIIKETRDKSTGLSPYDFRTLETKIDKMLNSVEIMRSKKSTEEVIAYVTEAITRRTDAIDETIETLSKIKAKVIDDKMTVKEAQQIIDETIKRSRESVIARLVAEGHGTDNLRESIEMIESTATRLYTKVKSIAKCIAEQQKKHVKSSVDGMKNWAGLFVSLAMAPFTCWLLNKIYPWFMDKAFPDLSNKAAAAKKDKNEKSGEVK